MPPITLTQESAEKLDSSIADVDARKDDWAKLPVATKVKILHEIKEATHKVSQRWVDLSIENKGIPIGSPAVSEEWFSGPYAIQVTCNLLIDTFSGMVDLKYLDSVPLRNTVTGQLVARVAPNSVWENLLINGVTAEVWMEKGVTEENLKKNTASAYDIPVESRKGKVCLVLGAGNVSVLAPLDVFQKVFTENQVVILKLNPVNDYLFEVLEMALTPLIDFGALRIVKGGIDVGQYLCNHPKTEEIHITGSASSHDAIVWGVSEEGAKNKRNNTPINSRKISSELGCVGPVIVVPGEWDASDIKFQAEHVATMKLYNAGYNCVACQVLVTPSEWNLAGQFIDQVQNEITNAPERELYYPGAEDRIMEFLQGYEGATQLNENDSPYKRFFCSLPLTSENNVAEKEEIFSPVLFEKKIDGVDPEIFLRNAVDYCNNELDGTLGANIIIHPKTLKQLGSRFEEILAELRYGCIAVNCWAGVAVLMTQTAWGAFPGHALNNIQSGRGFVHNTYMFDKPERTVITAPFRPFPRNLLSGELTLLPKPPWFITNKRAVKIGRLLTDFQYKPSWLKIPKIFYNALLG